MPLYKPNKYYRILSRYWDRIYKDKIPYQQTFKYIDNIREKEGLPKQLADVACGTGILLKTSEQEGYEIFWSDLSSDMLNQAKRKISDRNLLKGSYQEICLPKRFPLILSFFNSFAYCQDRIALAEVLNHFSNEFSLKSDAEFTISYISVEMKNTPFFNFNKKK